MKHTLWSGERGVDGPFMVTPDSRCDAGNALIVNRQEYFVHPERDPCSKTTDVAVSQNCASSREHKLFRTHSGECNNPDNPRWGSNYSPLARLLPSDQGKLLRSTHDKALSGNNGTCMANQYTLQHICKKTGFKWYQYNMLNTSNFWKYLEMDCKMVLICEREREKNITKFLRIVLRVFLYDVFWMIYC